MIGVKATEDTLKAFNEMKLGKKNSIFNILCRRSRNKS